MCSLIIPPSFRRPRPITNAIPYFGPVIVCGGLFAVALAQTGHVASRADYRRGAPDSVARGLAADRALMRKAEKMSALVVFVGLVVWT